MSASYPGGNFGGNQLLDGSIGLSPLYPGLKSDLHVSTSTGLHQGFPWLHPCPSIAHHLSGPNRHAPTRTAKHQNQGRSVVRPVFCDTRVTTGVSFLVPHGLFTHRLACMLDSLVRVSRRAGKRLRASILALPTSIGPPRADLKASQGFYYRTKIGRAHV